MQAFKEDFDIGNSLLENLSWIANAPLLNCNANEYCLSSTIFEPKFLRKELLDILSSIQF